MPPKKKVAAETEGGQEGTGAFRWTLENERKLLVLVQGRYLTGEDYDRLVTVFPGTNLNGVKIKVSRFRVEQRNMYEQLGWDLPEGGATKKPTTKKRTEAGDGEETAKKKARTTKKAGVEKKASEGEDDEEAKPEDIKKENGGEASVDVEDAAAPTQESENGDGADVKEPEKPVKKPRAKKAVAKKPIVVEDLGSESEAAGETEAGAKEDKVKKPRAKKVVAKKASPKPVEIKEPEVKEESIEVEDEGMGEA